MKATMLKTSVLCSRVSDIVGELEDVSIESRKITGKFDGATVTLTVSDLMRFVTIDDIPIVEYPQNAPIEYVGVVMSKDDGSFDINDVRLERMFGEKGCRCRIAAAGEEPVREYIVPIRNMIGDGTRFVRATLHKTSDADTAKIAISSDLVVIRGDKSTHITVTVNEKSNWTAVYIDLEIGAVYATTPDNIEAVPVREYELDLYYVSLTFDNA